MEQTEKNIYNCPICNSNQFELFLETKDYFLTKENFKLVKCSSCSFVFTNPRPPDNDLQKYYQSPDYLSHTARKRNLKDFVYQYLRSINIRRKFKLVKQFGKGNNILDIGSGTGELLNYFKKKGWNVVGIEPNEDARKFAVNTYQIAIYDEKHLNKLKENNFDVITLWHVLEHVPDLNKTLHKIKKGLKKNGYLVIAVPNIEAPDFYKYREKWAALDVPRHLYHFSPKTISLLLENHRFTIIDKKPMLFDAYYVSLLSEGYKHRKIPYLPAIINGFVSNKKAKKNNNYSSMIFVAKQK